MVDSFKTIASLCVGEFKDRGSKFHGYAFPLKTEEEVIKKLEFVKSEHFKARHHCYAYKLGLEGTIFRYNDDGEPSGTAGKPIYGQINSHELTDVLIVVVRYFGGTKLGASGLINAYKEGAKDALRNGEIITKYISYDYQLTFDYEHMGSIMNIIKSMELEIVDKVFESDCRVVVEIKKSEEISSLVKLKSTLLNVSPEYIEEETVVSFCKIEKIGTND